MVQPISAADWPRLNYKRRVYSAHTKGTLHIPSLGDRGGCATGPYRTPTTLGHTIRHRVKAALPNTQKQTQGGCQNKETKKHSPNERTDQSSRKRAK